MTEGMPDFSGLLAQAQQMQQSMVDAQEGLVDLQVEGSSGGGLVTAVVDGRGDLVSLSITPEAYDAAEPDALETLADLVVAAVRDAKVEAERQAADRISAASGGLAALGGSLGGLLGGADASPDPGAGLPGGLDSLLGLPASDEPAPQDD